MTTEQAFCLIMAILVQTAAIAAALANVAQAIRELKKED